MSGPFGNKGPLGGSQLTAGEVLWVQTGNAGVTLLSEQSSAPGATANVGKIYTLTSDGHLYYKDRSGVAHDITNSGGAVASYLPLTGTVNGITTIFTFSVTPVYIVSDGISYFNGQGCTITGTTVIMEIAPSSYLRAIA